MERNVFEYLKNKTHIVGQKIKNVFVPCSSQVDEENKRGGLKNALIQASCVVAAVLTIATVANSDIADNAKPKQTNPRPTSSVVGYKPSGTTTFPTVDNNITTTTNVFEDVVPPVVPSNTKINVWTYNLLRDGIDTQYGQVHKWANRRNYIVSQVRDAEPDIVGFQEVSASMNDFLSDELQGYSVTYYSKNNANASSQAIYYKSDRFEAIDSGMFYLSETPETESKSFGTDIRNCVWVKLKDKKDETLFYVYNIHYTHKAQDKEARRQSSELINSMTENLDAPVILLGDFNARSNEPAYKTLTEQYIDSLKNAESVVDSGNTYHGFNQSKYSKVTAIDHIWLSTNKEGRSDFIVSSYEVMDDYTEEFISKFGNVLPTEATSPIAPSDHYPVGVEVVLNNNVATKIERSELSTTTKGMER